MSLLICLAQLDFAVGDMPGNAEKIITAAAQAQAAGAHCLVTPSLAISGYGAQDWYWHQDFCQAAEQALQQVLTASVQWPQLSLLVGHPQWREGGGLCNALMLLRAGQVLHCLHQPQPSNTPALDGGRYFVAEPQAAPSICELAGVRLGVLWDAAPSSCALSALQQAGAQLLLAVDGPPYYQGQCAEREQALSACARRSGLPVCSVQRVGAQDEWLFAGQSLACQADGQLALRASAFEEALITLEVQPAAQGLRLSGHIAPALCWQEELWRALVLALGSYVRDNRFPGVLLGLSGGMDSALVLALAVDALGAERVQALMLPSPYTADISRHDARELAQRLGVRYDEIAIAPLFDGFKQALAPQFAGLAEDTTEENLQARIRGSLLMALSNKSGKLVVACGNKSELATGYCTLYGDMAGGFAAIKDVFKTQVFALARWRNANDPFGRGAQPIPERIITRPPSAELRPDQTDQDSLPAYEVLDAITQGFMERQQSAQDLVAAGFLLADVRRVLGLLQFNEYKRRQAPMGPTVSRRAFGSQWRYPMTQRYRA